MAYIINTSLRIKHSHNMYSDPIEVGINLDEVLYYYLHDKPSNALELMKKDLSKKSPMYKLYILFKNGHEVMLYGNEDETNAFRNSISMVM